MNSETKKFDQYARRYDALRNENIAASGEGIEYFARYKLECLRRLGLAKDEPVLDYGCGIGNVTEVLVEEFSRVHGFDPSLESLTLAKERAPGAEFHTSLDAIPSDSFGAVVLSGVLHHVPASEQPDVLSFVRRALRPGGRVVVFEHNPLNPLTQRAVRTCPFDDDAVLLSARTLRRSLERAGFTGVELQYIVFFPKFLSFLRPLEPRLAWCPFGAQTLTVGTR
jgi:ubiquinone/menaquinone biosynthesis C-methylase UbiE